MTNEATSYKTFKANAFLPRDRVDRIENVLIIGMPDVNVTCSGHDAWVEIKTVAQEPARKDTRLLSNSHELSQEQANWLLRHAHAGGAGFVYIDTPSRRYLINGRDADLVNSSNSIQLQLMADWCAPVPTPTERWKELRMRLMRL